MQFNSEFSITHVISLAGVAAIIFGAWGAYDKRTTVLEVAHTTQRTVDDRQDRELAEIKRTNREDFKNINDKLDKILLAAQSKSMR